MRKINDSLRKRVKEYENQQLDSEELRKLYNQDVITEIDTLKMKLSALQNASNVNEVYKRKLEELVEYKHRFEEISIENDSLRKQMFDIELKYNTEQRYHHLYEEGREELSKLKEELIAQEIQIKKLKTEADDNKKEVERLERSEERKDEVIRQMGTEIERIRIRDVCGDKLDSSVLGDAIEYEERIRALEIEIEDLKKENENYANHEIVKLENILQCQHEQSLKEKKEKDYYEERCNLLEKQNVELKNRVETLKIDSLSERGKTQEKDELLKTNRKLTQRLENFEERLSLEKSKFDIIQDENSFLKQSLENLKQEKEKLVELLGKNFGVLESLNQNIKSIESTKIQEINQIESERCELSSERSKEITRIKQENDNLAKQNMQFKMELKKIQQEKADKDQKIKDLTCQILFLELKGQEEKRYVFIYEFSSLIFRIYQKNEQIILKALNEMQSSVKTKGKSSESKKKNVPKSHVILNLSPDSAQESIDSDLKILSKSVFC